MKRIKKSNFWMGDRYYCAKCRKRVGYLDNFCCHCGDKIEWERCSYCSCSIESMTGDFCQDCGVAPIRRDKC